LGDSTVDVYSWDLCFWIIIMHLAVTLPLYFYISKSYSSIVSTPLSIWGYLCSIPIIFYMIWFFYLYLSDKNSLQVAQDIQSTIYLVMINLSAFIIYHVAILLIKEKKKAQELIQQNNLLTVQKIQYDNLQNRINEARRARHDLRHHIHLIQEYLHSGKLQELEAYLADYTETLPDSVSLVYCKHYAINAILDFFASRAKENGIELHFVNTAEVDDPVAYLRGMTDGTGFDDVLCYAPVAAVVEQSSGILGRDGCLNFFAGPTDKEFSAKINFYDVHYNSTHVMGTTGGNTADMIECLDLTAAGRINPAVMITHIGGLAVAGETILDLPKIPGGKKLIYNHIDLPLIALTDLREKGKEDERFTALADIVDAHRGLWCPEAEEYLLANFTE
jgi:hypothetical protein